MAASEILSGSLLKHELVETKTAHVASFVMVLLDVLLPLQKRQNALERRRGSPQPILPKYLQSAQFILALTVDRKSKGQSFRQGVYCKDQQITYPFQIWHRPKPIWSHLIEPKTIFNPNNAK
ncbi:unnamed protein product [Dovyalis caffra]|uniref:Uncharacterized protein n=1 Tax=Dovyalis caffra TaxID=77055 RepID=A0AAV1SI16_9ROSI|nr:unnamed protein product [Dovyalis caffra]